MEEARNSRLGAGRPIHSTMRAEITEERDTPELPRELEYLRIQTDLLVDAAQALVSRLQPLMRQEPAPPAPVGEKMPGTCTPVGSALRTLIDHIASTRATLRAALNALEL